MPNPEYPVKISLPENTNLLRKAAGRGVDVIDSLRAQVLLADWHLNDILQRQIRFSKDSSLFALIPRIKLQKRRPEDAEVPSELPPVQQATRYILSFSEQMKDAAVGGTIIDMQTKRERNVEGLVTCYDVGVGIGLIPALVDSIEGLKSYDEIEGIDDPTVKAFLKQYTEYPPQVTGDAVAAHSARFVRGNEETGIYVPEFVTAGALHGSILFTNIYNALTR